MGAMPEALKGNFEELSAKIKTLDSDHAKAYAEAEQLVETKKASGLDLTDLQSDDAKEVLAAFKAADEINDERTALKDRKASLLDMFAGDVITAGDDQDPERVHAAMSVGELFTASEEYAALKSSGILDSRAPFTTPPVQVASRDQTQQYLAAADALGLVPTDQRLMPPVPIPERRVRLLQLINVGATDSNTVEYAQETVRTHAAVEVAPGTASAEATYTWAKVTEPVKRIAHHTTAVRSQLADQGQAKTLIDGSVSAGLLLRTESQAVVGDGTGENFTGIANAVGVGTVALGVAPDTHPEAVHRAITTVRVALEDDITAVGLHPTDYESFVLTRDDQNNYVNNQSTAAATAPSIWGYPAIVSTVFAQGTAYVGNWRRGSTLWVRSGVQILTGYINDQLIEDMITVAGEYRAAYAVTEPKAFATVTGL